MRPSDLAGAVGQFAEGEANSAEWPVQENLPCGADCVHDGREGGPGWTALVAVNSGEAAESHQRCQVARQRKRKEERRQGRSLAVKAAEWRQMPARRRRCLRSRQ